MSKERFECEHNWIIDNNKRKTNESLIVYDEEWNTLDDLCELLNQQSQRIAELEGQLKNAIVPKFKVGQEVWYIEDNQVNSATIDDMWIEFNGGIEHYFNLDLSDGFGLFSKTNDEKWEPHFGIGTYYVFGTEEEAQARLQELRGE